MHANACALSQERQADLRLEDRIVIAMLADHRQARLEAHHLWALVAIYGQGKEQGSEDGRADEKAGSKRVAERQRERGREGIMQGRREAGKSGGRREGGTESEREKESGSEGVNGRM